jgi:hypothetical protein
VHPQLATIVTELGDADTRLRRLAAAVPAGWWLRRADPARWSIAECVAHLNLASEAYLPLIRDGLECARRLGQGAPARYRRDPMGWLLWRMAGPPVRCRVRTTAPFIPQALASVDGVLETFHRLQVEQVEAVRQGDGLPLHRVRITSPFDARIRYNLYAALTMLAPHQHRHLWQAERVLEQLRGAG